MRFLIPLTLLLCAAAPASRAADLLFAFGADGEPAHVYEASSLTLRATPQVVSGARVALGRPGSGGYDRYYVVGQGGVSVLDASFREVAQIPLPDEPLGQWQPAVFAAQSGSLLVVAGSKAYRIDTAREAVDKVAEVGTPLAGVALREGSRYAYLVGANGRTVWRMEVETGLLDGPTVTLPETVNALQGARAAGETGLSEMDLALLPSAFFQPGERPSRTLVSAASPLSQTAGAQASSPDGRYSWTITNEGGLLKTDASGQTAAVMAPEGSFQTISLLPEPVEGQGQGPQLEKVSGDGQVLLAGQQFSVQVALSTLTGSVPLTTSAVANLIVCDDENLNTVAGGPTTVNCTVAASVPSTTQVALTVSALGSPVVFSIVVVPPGLQNGVTVFAGGTQTVAVDSTFSFSVRAIQGGLPAANQMVNVISISPAVASCPPTRTLSLLGEATFDCTAQFVGALTPVTLTVSDGFSSAQVMVNIAPATGGVGGLSKISPDPSTALEGTSFSLVVEARTDSVPQPGVTLNVSVANILITCPASVTTGANGRATIPCQAGQVTQNTSIPITVSEGARTLVFTVTVADQSVTDGLQIVSGNNQIVSQNSEFPQKLVVSARVNGVPQPNLLLNVQTTGMAVFCSQQVQTDNMGIGVISCNAGPVVGITTVQIQVTDAFDRSLAIPFTATVSPTAVGLASTLEVLTADPLLGTVGAQVAGGIRVRALNELSEPVPGVTVYFRSAQDITFSPAVATTNLSGEATAAVTFGCPSPNGSIQIGLTSTSTQATIAYRAGNGQLSQLQILQGNNQSGSPGVRMGQALLVRTADVCGNPVPSTPVAWGVNPPEAAALEVVGAISNGQGQASALVRPTARGGAFQVLVAAQADSAIQATFNLTTGNVPTLLQKPQQDSGDGQQVPANSIAADPLVVLVLNETGAPVAGVDVAFAVTSGNSSLESINGRTDPMGRATARFRAGSELGPATVQATALGQSVTFTLNVIGSVPVLTADGFVNAASFRPGLSPGSAASIFARNITGDVQGVLAAPYTPGVGFPTTLEGLRVLVNGTPAPILAIVNINGQEQLNIQVPFETAGNFATVVVENNGSQGTITNVPIFNPQPAVFEVNVEGGTFAAALHADFSLITPSNPARPGETIQVFLTGLGRLSPPVATNAVGPIPPALTVVTPEVTLDGVLQTVVGSFYAPQLISVYQVNMTLGANAAVGNRALQITSSGVGSKIVLLPVGPNL